jgi:hypothetical protein
MSRYIFTLAAFLLSNARMLIGCENDKPAKHHREQADTLTENPIKDQSNAFPTEVRHGFVDAGEDFAKGKRRPMSIMKPPHTLDAQHAEPAENQQGPDDEPNPNAKRVIHRANLAQLFVIAVAVINGDNVPVKDSPIGGFRLKRPTDAAIRVIIPFGDFLH